MIVSHGIQYRSWFRVNLEVGNVRLRKSGRAGSRHRRWRRIRSPRPLAITRGGTRSAPALLHFSTSSLIRACVSDRRIVQNLHQEVRPRPIEVHTARWTAGKPAPQCRFSSELKLREW
ncbi:hypothetical protein ACMD2_19997 [Ananas comosus]|uniref:Uncharacterized protein n=1 Tax=Ananas comosus TaxID=4615 RepID=A0A199VU94_ANACO|nr:hypothetical protein ACMD2_19997 [Ananas comosus]